LGKKASRAANHSPLIWEALEVIMLSLDPEFRISDPEFRISDSCGGVFAGLALVIRKGRGRREFECPARLGFGD